MSWAEPLARFTLLFERMAIDVLLETDISAAAQLLGLSWDEAHHIMNRAVERGLKRRPATPPRLMGVDEKAVGAGQSYATVVYDLEHGHVVELKPGRSKAALLDSLGAFTLGQIAQVEAVALDMCEPYIQFLKEVVPPGRPEAGIRPLPHHGGDEQGGQRKCVKTKPECSDRRETNDW